MTLRIHYMIGKNVCSELKESGHIIHEKLFLLGNLFPDLIHSYLWCPHRYKQSREFIRKKLDKLKKRPRLFSFQLGILAHYICDYFCYPHSARYESGFIQHILYEIRQKVPKNFFKLQLNKLTFSIHELDSLVEWYNAFRTVFRDDESDLHIASNVAFNFLQAAY
ncbi:MAG: zinc dependent phospholipase C family protein [Treponema sp.]|nr:zinc dependent phospholipase C family protein [Treponema sp.]